MAVLPHAGLSDQAGIVLLPAAKDLDHARKFALASDDPVQLALARFSRDILTVSIQKFSFRRLLRFPLLGATPRAGSRRAAKIAAQQLIKINRGRAAAVGGGGICALLRNHLLHKPVNIVGHLIELLVADTHFFQNIVDWLDTEFFCTFQANPLVFGFAVFQPRYKYHSHSLVAACTHLHSGTSLCFIRPDVLSEILHQRAGRKSDHHYADYNRPYPGVRRRGERVEQQKRRDRGIKYADRELTAETAFYHNILLPKDEHGTD